MSEAQSNSQIPSPSPATPKPNLEYRQNIDPQIPVAVLGTIQTLIKDVKKTQDDTVALQTDMREHRGLLIFGFIVLLVMVATLIIMVFQEWKNSNDRLLEKVDSLYYGQQTTISKSVK